MIETMIRIPLKGSEIRPLIMVIEDLHWMDKSSEDVLKYLLESISGARIFLIFTYRPEFVHTWGGKSYHNQLNLNRLSNRESLAMVNYLLGTEDIESELEDLILEKTEGVPFFIEELIKSLKEVKIIEKRDGGYCLAKNSKDVAIPGTIQDVIMARVDSLPDEAKAVLQAGSVIEREFSYDLIKTVTSIQEQELLSHLSALKDTELIYERGIFPKSAFIFRHALTREVVYDSILKRRKKELHERIGEAIEKIFEDNLNEHYGILSEHFSVSENYAKGAKYCRLAARAAEQKASFIDATIYGEKGIDCLEKLPKTEEAEKQIIDARTTLGLYYLQRADYIESKNVVDPVVNAALRLGYKRRISNIYSIIGANSIYVDENFTKASKYLEDALKIAEELKDNLSLVMAVLYLGVDAALRCEFEKALYYYEKTLKINEAANSLWGIILAKGLTSFFVHNCQGRIDLGYQNSIEALHIQEKNDDISIKFLSNCTHGTSCYYRGLLDEAEEFLLKGSDFSETLGIWDSWAKWYLGETYFDMGKYQQSHDYYNKASLAMEHSGLFPSMNNFYKVGSVRAKVMNNEKDIDLESLYGYMEANKIKWYEGWMPRYLGEILLNIDDQHTVEAEDWLKKAIEADKKNGMRWHLGRDYAIHAELFIRKGDPSKARENLNKAIEILRECGADGWVQKYEKELAAI